MAGILKGDIIIQMGDIEIKGMTQYMEALNVFEKNDKIEVLVIRNGEQMAIDVQFD